MGNSICIGSTGVLQEALDVANLAITCFTQSIQLTHMARLVMGRPCRELMAAALLQDGGITHEHVRQWRTLQELQVMDVPNKAPLLGSNCMVSAESTFLASMSACASNLH